MAGAPTPLTNLVRRIEALERELATTRSQWRQMIREAKQGAAPRVRLVKTFKPSGEEYPAAPANTFRIRFVDLAQELWEPGERTKTETPRSATEQTLAATIDGSWVPKDTLCTAIRANRRWWIQPVTAGVPTRWAVAADGLAGSGLEDEYFLGDYRLVQMTNLVPLDGTAEAQAQAGVIQAYTMSNVNVLAGESVLLVPEEGSGSLLAFPRPRNIWQIFTGTPPTANGEVTMTAGGSSGHAIAISSGGRITFQARGTYDVHIRWDWSQDPADESEISFYPDTTANGVEIHLGYPASAFSMRTSTHGPGWDHLHTRVTCLGDEDNELPIAYWKHFGSDPIAILSVNVFITHVADALPFAAPA